MTHVDGVMLGRAAYQNAGDSGRCRREILRRSERTPWNEAVDAYLDYVARQFAKGVPLHAMTRHMLGLFNARRGARQFRRHLSENATRAGADITVLRDALSFVAQPEECAV